MTGQIIERAEVRRPDLRWPFPADMATRLTGARIERLRRRSKYILADLDRGETLLIHLGMSGRMTITGNGSRPAPGIFVHDHKPLEPHDHVIFHMAGGMRVTFNDPRRFGAMDLLDSATADQHKLLASLGPEPLGNHFDADHLATALKGRRTPMKSALLDQRIVAGLGNIYVCEALWRAGISPIRKAASLSRSRVDTLVPIIRDVLREAIEAGGSSLRDHRQADGALGYFQHSFAAYGREGEPCRHADCDGKIARIVQSGRSTFYCKACQR